MTRWSSRGIGSFALLLLLAGCGGGHRSTDTTNPTTTTSTTLSPAEKLGSSLLPLFVSPGGDYQEDPSAGAMGSITPSAFTQLGGSGTAATDGYVGGYRIDYVDSDTEEGLTTTILKFSTSGDASNYFKSTATRTLAAAAPTQKAFPGIPGALQLIGTKAFDGDWVTAVVMTHGTYYASVTYLTAVQTKAPIEFATWCVEQWNKLH